MFDHAVYNLLKNKGWKNQSFLISGTFTAPITGLYFINGTGGGGGGSIIGGGGASGAACNMSPVYLEKGSSVSVAIAAGGAIAGIGGTTSFGAYVVLPGGNPGPINTVGEVSSGGLRSFKTGTTPSGGTSPDAVTIGSYVSGASVFALGSGVYIYGASRYSSTTHAGGYFGATGDNSGAGGNTNSAGYSGRLDVMWQE